MNTNKPKCKGKVFKGKVNTFLNKDGHIIQKKILIPLKQQSCNGCSICGWMEDFIKEDIALESFSSLDFVEHNKIYSLCYNISYNNYFEYYDGDIELFFTEIG